MITNILMIAMSSVAAFLVMDFLAGEKINTKNKRYILSMGIFVFLWVTGYAYLGITDDFSRANIYRIIGIIGIDGFLMTELYFIIKQGNANKNIEIFIHFFFSIISAIDVVLFGNPQLDTFVRLTDRTAYYSNQVWQRNYHNAYIAVMTLSLAWAGILWKKSSSSKREKTFVLLIFCSNVALLLGTIPDTFLPIYGIPSWPSSAVGGFITYCFICHISKRYDALEITETSLKDFMYDYSAIGIMSFHLYNRLAEANQYTRKLLGITKDSEVRLSDLFCISLSEEKDIFNNVLSGQEVRIKAVTKLTGINTVLILKVENDENGYPYSIFGTVIDQTKEDEMIKKLYELNESKSAFLANMSHEIRTPVNTVMGMNEMILRNSNDNRIRGYATNIKSSCNLLISIINDILDFSKIESGDIDIVEKEYDLGQMIRSLVELMEERTNRKGLSMYLDIDENLPKKLYGDEMRIRQVVTNLLTNACKYTDHGTVTLKMGEKGVKEDSINLCIDVIDSGKGIRKEDQKKLFEAFSRVDEKRNRHIEGTGLGLSITSHFVSLMDGNISVESEYGKGSDFSVVIPQRVESDEKIGNYRESCLEFDSAYNENEIFVAPGKKVLLVDDNEMNLNVAALLLQETQMDVDKALSGKEALDLMRKEKYDILFFDHMMPQMDGIELLHLMKDEKLQQDVPVIVLTANAIAGAREMYVKFGFDDYLSKPIVSVELNQTLQKWLGNMKKGEAAG